jgi:hypothetical protein
MTKPAEKKRDRFEREIECPTDGQPIKRRVWASLDGLDRMEVESIGELRLDDIRKLASYGEGGIDSECEPCALPAAGRRLAQLGGASPAMPTVPRRRRDNDR